MCKLLSEIGGRDLSTLFLNGELDLSMLLLNGDVRPRWRPDV